MTRTHRRRPRSPGRSAGSSRLLMRTAFAVLSVGVGASVLLSCRTAPETQTREAPTPDVTAAGPVEQAEATTSPAVTAPEPEAAVEAAARPETVQLVTVEPAAAPRKSNVIDLIDPAKPRGGFSFGNGPEFPGATGDLAIDDTVNARYRPALKLSGDFTKGGNYVQTGCQLPEVNVDTISFWIKSPEARHITLRVIDGSKQCHQINVKLESTEAWQKVNLPIAEFFKRMGTSSSLSYVTRYEKWGGANDGRWHDPCVALYLLTGRGAVGDDNVGAIWLSGVRVFKREGREEKIQKTVRLDDLIQEGDVDWSFTLGQEFPGAKGSLEAVPEAGAPGGHALRMRGDFTGGGRYVGTNADLTTYNAERVAPIRFKAKSRNTTGFSLRVGDASGQCHQRPGFQLKADGQWHEFVVDPDEVAGGEHWGGKNDGKFHHPAQYLSVIIGGDGVRELLLSDITADIVVKATVKPASYRESFEAAGLPAGWDAAGTVAVARERAFKGQGLLRLARTEARINDRTRAVGASFTAAPGGWLISGAYRPALYSPDDSYRGSIELEALGGGGRVIERKEVALGRREKQWKSFSRQIDLPAGTTGARFVVRLDKTYGSFDVDELSAAHVAADDSSAKKVDRIVLYNGAVGNLLRPDQRVTMKVEVHALKPLTAEERQLTWSVRDYWGAEQAEPRTVALVRGARGKGKRVYEATVDLGGLDLAVGTYYEFHASIERPGGDPYEQYSAFARLPEPASRRYSADEIPFTVRSWDGRIRDYHELAHAIGQRSIGLWGDNGVDFIRSIDCKWITGVGSSDVERNGFKNTTEKKIYDGTYAFVKKNRDRGLQAICLGNEPHGTGKKVLDNVKAYKAAYEGAKAAWPECFVIATSVNHSEEYFKAGYHNYCDAYDFHVYETYRDVRNGIRLTRELMNKYDAPKPIWTTEIGLNSQGQTRLTVAAELIKKVTSFFAEGGEVCAWFGIQYPDGAGKARGTSGDSHNVFDCAYNRFNPRLDAIAYYNMINGILVKKFVEEKEYPDETQSYLFRDADGNCMHVLWRDGESLDAFVPISGVRDIELIRIDGSHAKLSVDGDGVTVTVGFEPVILMYAQKTGTLADALGKPRITVETAPPPILKGASCTIPLVGERLSPSRIKVITPPRWTATASRGDAGGVALKVTAPENTAAREGRIIIQRIGAGGSVAEEIYAPLKITSPIELMVLPMPPRDGGDPQLEVRIRNNCRQKQSVRWDVALPEELTVNGGSFDLTAWQPSSAYLAGIAEGELELEPGRTYAVRVAVADMQSTNIYRVRANVVDQTNRTISYERKVGGFAGAPRAKQRVTVDGSLDEAAWKRGTVSRIADGRQYYIMGERPLEEDWTGASDLSADLRFAWDDEALYVGVTVTDDVHRVTRRGGALWQQDALQFMIDPSRTTSVKPGKYDYSIGQGLDGPQAWCHMSASAKAPGGAAKDIRVAVRRDEAKKRTVYEIAVPWHRIAPFTPGTGANLGLSMILNEDDGQGRHSFMGWFSGVHSKQLDMAGDVTLTE